jgi:hypothetical protein
MHSIAKKLALFSGVFALILFFANTPVEADEWDRATVFSINHAFEVPGKVLEPNTRYMIKLLDSPGTRDVIQIFNEDRTQLITTFFGIPDIKPDYVEETEFEFMEVPAGNPMPIRTWHYPGRRTGHEFLYPKAQLERIAAYSAAPVQTAALVTPAPVVEPARTEVVEPPDAGPDLVAQNLPVNPAATQAEPEPIEKIDPPIERSKPEAAPEPAQAEAAPAAEAAQLPETADWVSAYGLAGALSLLLGFGVRATIRRS